MTVSEVYKKSKNFGAGLMALNLIPEVEGEGRKWRFLGMQSKNRREWNLAHMGNYLAGGTTIALYDTLGPEATRFVCNETELVTICCSNDLIANIIKLKTTEDNEGQMQRITAIIGMDGAPSDADKTAAAGAGITIHTFDEVLAAGEANTSWAVYPATEDDVYMFSYTSGTTGNPKGVKLSHKMILQCAQSTVEKLENQRFTQDDCYISYLPAAHSFEQALQGTAMITGMRTGFYGGDPLKLVAEDLPALKPTFFPAVPRILNRIYGKLQDAFKAATGCKATLIQNGLATKLANYRANGVYTHGCYDIIFKKVKMMTGGRVRFMITGSAPISADVLDFLKVCFCCPIVEGYGMTETSAGSFTTMLNDPLSGHVGGPQANVKIRLRDLPEMGYSSKNEEPTGECVFWGPSIMKGYYKNPEKTAEAFEGDPANGWLKSGDVVKVFPNGSIKIIDRAKNIFKLS